jgi:hypothetical protein
VLGQPPTALGKGPQFLTGCSLGEAGNSSLPEGDGHAQSAGVISQGRRSWRCPKAPASCAKPGRKINGA